MYCADEIKFKVKYCILVYTKSRRLRASYEIHARIKKYLSEEGGGVSNFDNVFG